MRILLSVPLTRWVKNPPPLPDIGLGYLAGSLRRAGHDVWIHGWNNRSRPEAYLAGVERLSPDLVGIKVFTKDVPAANKTIGLIKEKFGSIKVAVGGPHPSAREPAKARGDFPLADFVLRGEAEAALPRLLDGLSGGTSDMGGVIGLVWNEGKAVRWNAPLLSGGLDGIGFPAWDLMDPGEYPSFMLTRSESGVTSAPMIATRGCPYGCGFCYVRLINGGSVRERSQEDILAEIELLTGEYGVGYISFQDANFFWRKEFARDVCEALLERGSRLSWDCVASDRLDDYTPGLAALMRRAGCRAVIMGIESGAPRIREAMGQEPSVEEIRRAAALFREAGIEVRGFFMFGFPDETRADVRKTVDLASSLDMDFTHFEVCYPLPGTEVYERVKRKYGLEDLDWMTFDVIKTPYHAGEVPSGELEGLAWKLNMRYARGTQGLSFIVRQYVKRLLKR